MMELKIKHSSKHLSSNSIYLLLNRSSLLWSESRSGWEAVVSPSFTCCEKTVSECCEDDAVKLEDRAGGMVGGKPVPI